MLNVVSCNDNSAFCDITYYGEIVCGVIGEYIINYTEKGLSENTANKKRLITVE